MLNEPLSFTIDVTGSITGETYKGAFKARPRLSHRDQLKRDQFRRELLWGDGAGAGGCANNISQIFAKIWVHLAESPSWWKDAANGLDLTDEEPIVAVYEQILKLESEAIAAIKAKAEEAKKELATKE
jgi:hypothetical protein